MQLNAFAFVRPARQPGMWIEEVLVYYKNLLSIWTQRLNK